MVPPPSCQDIAVPLPESGERYELGVLLVHGIGESRRGDTLVNWGGPLIDTLRGLLRGPRGTDDPTGPDVGKVRAVLREVAEDPAAPAHAEVTLTEITALRDPASPLAARSESRWLIAESCWGEEFPTPTVQAMETWSRRILPWTLVNHFDQALRRRGFRQQAATSTGAWIAAGARALAAALGVLAAFLLSPLLVAVMYLLTLPALVPIDSVRSAVAWCQRKLAGVLGDSYVFLGEPIARAAILERVRRDLSWLQERGCAKIAVIAHSQGGAVVHALLRQERESRCDLLVSFGSGLRKLSEIETALESPVRPLLTWSTVCFFSTALALLGLLVAPAVGPPLASPTVSGGRVQILILLGMLSVQLLRGFLRTDRDAPGFLTIAKQATEHRSVLTRIRLAIAASHDVLRDPKLAQMLRAGARRLEAGPVALALLSGAALLAVAQASGNALSPFEGVCMFLALAGLLVGLWLYICWQVKSGRAVEPAEQEATDRARFEKRFRLPQPDLEWVDVYASHDPVSSGALFDSRARIGPRPIEVLNLQSQVADHTAYWYNRDEFVVRLLDRLLGLAGLELARGDATAPSRIQLAWLRRRWRMTGRTVARWILATSFLTTLGLWAVQPPAWASVLLERLRGWLAAKHWLPGWLDPTPELGFLSALGIAVLALVFLLLGNLARGAWHAWNRRDQERVLRHGRLGFVHPGFVLALVLTVLPPVATALLRWPLAAGALVFAVLVVLVVLVIRRRALIARSASLPLSEALAACRDRLPPDLAPTPPAS